MSAAAEPPSRSVLSILSRSLGREKMSWVISALFHACLVMLLLSFWIVVIRPKSDLSVGPVAGEFHRQAPALRTGAPDADELKLAGPSLWPAGARVFKLEHPDVFGRAGVSGERQQVDMELPRGGADKQLRLPGRGGHPGLTGIGGPKGRHEAGPLRVVYVLDASGSMIGDLDVVKKRLMVDLSRLAFDENAGRVDSFNIIFFRDRPQVLWPRLLPASNRNKIAAARWVRRVRAWGQTEPAGAMKAAFGFRPSHVVVLSDGEFDEQLLAVVDGLQRSCRPRVKIIAIAYGKDFVGNNLQKLAARNGGAFIRLSGEWSSSERTGPAP